MIKFEVEGRAISLNQIYTSHWHQKQKINQEWQWRVKAGLLKFHVQHLAIEQSVEINFIVYVKRPVDPDNAIGTAKIIIDFLKFWGVLPDDSPKWIRRLTIEVVPKSEREYIAVSIV